MDWYSVAAGAAVLVLLAGFVAYRVYRLWADRP